MKSIYMVLFSLLLTACASKTVVTNTQLSLVEIPPEFLVQCRLSEKPIDPIAFRTMTIDQKNLAMYAMTDLALEALLICNAQIQSIADWQIKQKAIINKKE